MLFVPPARRLRAPVVLALASVIFGAAAFHAPRPVNAMFNCGVADTTFDSTEQQFLSLINQYRGQNGLGAFTVSENLNRSASWLANDMATKSYMSHTDSLGRSLGPRLQDCETVYSAAAENVAAGYDSAQAVFNGWRNSSSHNANMLATDLKQIGIARAYNSGSRLGYYWATDFSSIDDGTRAGSRSEPALARSQPSAPAAPNAATLGATVSKAIITSPAQASQLADSSATFEWTPVSGANEYFLYVGTSRGAKNVFGRSQALVTSTSVSGLPDDGSMVYVRLWTRIGSAWSYNDHVYRAVDVSLSDQPLPPPADLETTEPS